MQNCMKVKGACVRYVVQPQDIVDNLVDYLSTTITKLAKCEDCSAVSVMTYLDDGEMIQVVSHADSTT